jgi:hydroxymethylpyrimidine pyrophosphatase-like HAD family hydrolase
MFFLALATDYDGTIANHGSVDRRTRDALRRLKQTGRRLVLVTGRELADLQHAFPELDLFDRVVVENGAVIHDPESGSQTLLAPPPSQELVLGLIARKVEPISVGHCIVATWEPHQAAVLETIRELGLELEIIFNKGAVMVLPAGITKASGLRAALADLDISPHNVVGVGDAENDHAFLHACGCSGSVANALPRLRDEAHVKLSSERGEGVIELIDRIIHDDGRLMAPARLGLPIGIDREGREVHLMPHQRVLVVGDTQCGKTRFAKMLTEKMVEKAFQFVIIDPEGDYEGLQHSVGIAEPATAPRLEEALAVLRRTGANVVINTVALDMAGRRQLVSELLAPISDLAGRSGRPHWVIVDEAHQSFPEGRTGPALPDVFPAAIFITVAPEGVSKDVLQSVDVVIAFGSAAAERLAHLGRIAGYSPPSQDTALHGNEVLAWFRDGTRPAFAVKIDAPRQFHRRHSGKYAVGDVGEARSFYFRGPDNSTAARAKNVCEFARLGRQLGDATWEHHLRRNDYSAWFRDIIGDDELASETRQIEDDRTMTPSASRAKISSMILSRYAAPLS